MRFSLRDAAVATALLCAMLTAFFHFGLMIAAFAGLTISAGLFVFGLRTHRSLLMWMGLTCAVPCALLSVVTLLAWIVLGYGPVFSQSSWPTELKRMVEITGADPRSVRAYGLGEFLDSDMCWRLPVVDGDVEALSASLNLIPASDTSFPRDFWRSFPWQWRPRKTYHVQYFISNGEAELYVLVDRRAGLAYVLYHFDF